MSPFKFALLAAAGAGLALTNTSVEARSGIRVHGRGYAPAYFAPAHYDATPYRGVVGPNPYYPFWSDWQIRWRPHD